MKLTFLGADHEVTGSCHYIQACGKNILLDCGMEQGSDVYENQKLPVPASDLDYIFLSHAHIDHSGLIPMMYSHGFRGQIFTTEATRQLCDIMLKDSAHIQEFEAEWRNRKARRSDHTLKEFVPIYTMEDAVNCMKYFVGCEYDKVYEICEGIKLRFVDVGHLLGSASIEIWITEAGITKKILFSGDIGNVHKPIIKDPQYVKDADYVIMESTYGDRSHGGTPDYIGTLVDIFRRTFDRGGNVIIPSFAVGRTQEILYFIRQIVEQDLVGRDFDVYLDSPLAIEATQIFRENIYTCFDDEAMELVKKGINPLTFKGLKVATTTDESRALNEDDGTPKVIISASGMCEAGRIRHHLKHNLWRTECTILFVGYQAVGTTGRLIVDGAKELKLFGEPISVRAEIAMLPGASGHADREGLLKWINSLEEKPKHVFVVHGEDHVCDTFTELLHDKYGFNATAPYTGEVWDLATDSCLETGNKEKKERRISNGRKSSAVFMRLVAAGQRLMTVIHHNEGGANKDLAKFADQINALCEKWDR